jgi:hypothetical protein
MRIFACLLVMLFAVQTFAADCVWLPVTGATRSKVATGAANCTFTEATASATDGMWLDSVGAFSVMVCADAGQTVTTSFALNAYVYDSLALVWAPAVAWNLAANTGINERCQPMGGFSVSGPVGRIAFAPSAGAVSSGNITIRINAVQVGRYDSQTQL